MAYRHIEVSKDQGVMTIRLNRPDRMNAFTTIMANELVESYQQASADDEVKVVVLTGAGKAFCAGADLGLGEDTFNYDESKAGDELERIRDTGGLVTLAMFECTKPIIAAINGAAVGIGITMTLAADIRLTTDKAKFGFVFTQRGIVPEAGSSWFLPRIVGISQALEWMISGKIFAAAEAKEGGLVKESFASPEELMAATNAMAEEIASSTSAISVALTRQMLWRMLGADHPMEAH
ncbi:MAG: enoyl-CoA hydratase-related protein, partial [Pseudomonadales bacterium]|nr:enoyl-CoA hydratase-related protein [Pseudomonadales bacterium]